MVKMLKYNRRTLTSGEIGAVSGVRSDVSVVADAVCAELLSLDEFLRDPRIIGIKRQRGEGLFNGGPDQGPGGEAGIYRLEDESCPLSKSHQQLIF